MVFAQLLDLWSVTDRTAEMAERVAGRSRLAVWQRVVDRLPTLGPTEARGYIRARALSVVEEETGRLVEQEGPKVARHRTRIAEQATDTLIAAIIAQLQQRRLPAAKAA
jgi:hypothetical protein